MITFIINVIILSSGNYVCDVPKEIDQEMRVRYVNLTWLGYSVSYVRPGPGAERR